MASEEQISVGFFADFHDPTMLFWGSSDALRRFAGFLRNAGRQGRVRAILNEENGINPIRGIRIRLEISVRASGMLRASGAAAPDFTWCITATQADKFADLVESLAKSQKPGHHYLDCEARDDIVVVVSMGEYDDLDTAAN